MFLDFAALKEQVSFEDAIQYLDLVVKRSGNQWRGACPACKSGGDRALVITEGKGFYCFGGKKGGDQIALAAHVLDCSVKDAAAELAMRAGVIQSEERTSSRTVPKERDGSGPEKLAPLSYLEHEHPAVDAIGFDPHFAKEYGIGYAPRGIMRGTVAVPIRDENGVLLGYIGITEAKLPSDFTAKVIPLDKKRA